MNKRFRSRSDDPETVLSRPPALGLAARPRLPPPPPIELLTVTETAKLLKVCTKTVHRLKNDGDLKYSRVGNQIRINRHSINVYLGLVPGIGRQECR